MIEECYRSLATLTILAPQLAHARDQCRGVIAEIEATLTALSLGIKMEVESKEEGSLSLAYERLSPSTWGLSARVYQRTPGAAHRILLSTTPLAQAPISTCLLLIPLIPLLLSELRKAAAETLAQLEQTREIA